MAYLSCQDWAIGSLCCRAGSDEDMDMREEFIIVVLFSLEWLVFVGIIGFLTFKIISQTIWKKEKEQEVGDIAVLQKPPPTNEEQQQEEEVDEYELNEYAEYDVFEFKFGEDFYENLNFLKNMNEEDCKEEEDGGDGDYQDDDDDYDDDYDDADDADDEDDTDDADNEDSDDSDDEDADDADDEDEDDEDEDDDDDYDGDYDKDDEDDDHSGLTVDRFLSEGVKDKLYYYFHDLDDLESQSVVTDEPTTCECDTSDAAFEGIANEEQWEKDENGDLEGWFYKDWDYQEEDSLEHRCKA